MRYLKYFELHLIVLLWGFTAILGVLISIPPIEIVFYRTLVSFLGIFILLKFRKESIALSKKDTLKLVSTGILFSVHWILFFGAARESNVSVTLVGMSTVALWTSILDPLINNKRIQLYEILIGLGIVAGLYMVFRVDATFQLGLIMAILSALCAALFMIINSRYTRRINNYQIMGFEMFGAWLTTLLFMPIYKMYLAGNGTVQLVPTLIDWFYILVLALVCTIYAYSASVRLMKKLSAYAVNLTATLEPVYGIILALVIFGEKERMTINFYIGAAIILIAVFSYPIIRKRVLTKTIKAS